MYTWASAAATCVSRAFTGGRGRRGRRTTTV